MFIYWSEQHQDYFFRDYDDPFVKYAIHWDLSTSPSFEWIYDQDPGPLEIICEVTK